ncbi:MAG: stage II sporulation protein M [Gammaproteobacteria bacterium]|jgi:uncharacterized membrane protein SpoIIM required for sporulation
MRQFQFQEQHETQWQQLEELLDGLESGRRASKPDAQGLQALPTLYRDICQHLALAQSRCYSPGLIDRLHALTLRAHHQIYKREFRIGRRILDFLVSDFPSTLHRHARFFWLSFLLFFGPGILFGLTCYLYPDMIYTLMDDVAVAKMESMYDPAPGNLPGREEAMQDASRMMMFGFYVNNNTGIGFRTFAGGILAGLGTLFFLVFNGVVIGGVAGYLTRLDYIETFWGFVIGHGSFELIAIVISGTAGLLLGKAIVAPGNYSRLEALRRNAKEAIVLVSGAACMFVIAALIEAFWSPLPVDASLKYGVGALLWLLVGCYLYFTGRNTNAA